MAPGLTLAFAPRLPGRREGRRDGRDSRLESQLRQRRRRVDESRQCYSSAQEVNDAAADRCWKDCVVADSLSKKFCAVFEDDGETGYFYAVQLPEHKILDAVRIYNGESVMDRSASPRLRSAGRRRPQIVALDQPVRTRGFQFCAATWILPPGLPELHPRPVGSLAHRYPQMG